MTPSTRAPGNGGRCVFGARARGHLRAACVSLAIALALGAALTACSPTVRTHGYMPNPDGVAAIKSGATNREGVRDLLGSPTSIGTFDDKRWYYVSRKAETSWFDERTLLDQEIVIVDFDDGGVVKTVEVIKGIDKALKVDMVSRTTPTKGRELTFMEQLLGNFGGGRLSKKNEEGRDTLSRSPTRRGY
jgi:outer membrane protein assembly factor BamE (lipoprotein component of BamABCDE complex)